MEDWTFTPEISVEDFPLHVRSWARTIYAEGTRDTAREIVIVARGRWLDSDTWCLAADYDTWCSGDDFSAGALSADPREQWLLQKIFEDCLQSY